MVTKAIATPMPVLPSREFRRLLEGIRGWIDAMGKPGSRVPCVGVLEGEEGSGKGLLLDALRGSCPELGLRWWGGSFRGTSALPGGAFAEVLEQGLRESSAGNRGETLRRREREAFARRAESLTRLVPGASWPPGTAAPSPPLDASWERSRSIDSLVLALLESAREEPGVLSLEGIEGADPLSRELLAHLFRVLDNEGERLRHRLLVVVSRHTRRAPEEEPAIEGLPEHLVGFRIRVRGFARDDLCEHARRSGTELSVSRRESLYRTTRGNVRRARWLLKDPAGCAGLEDGGEIVPAALRALRHLPEASRWVIGCLALLGSPVPVGWLRDVVTGAGGEGGDSSGDGESWDQLLSDLHCEGWLRLVGGREGEGCDRAELEPWLEEAVAQGEDRDRLLAGAASAVRVLAKQPPRDGRDAFDRARRAIRVERWLRRQGGRAHWSLEPCGDRPGFEETLLEAGERAADWLEELGLPLEALEWIEELRRTVAGDVPPEKIAALDRRVTGLLTVTGSFREARDAIAPETTASGDASSSSGSDSRSDWRQRALVEAGLGRHEEELDAWRRAADSAAVSGDDSARLTALAGQAAAALRHGRTELADEACRRGLRIALERAAEAEASVPPGAHGELLLVAAELARNAGRLAQAEGLELRAAELFARAREPRRQVESLLRASRLASAGGRAEIAPARIEAALEAARQSGSRRLVARVLQSMGRFCRERGHSREAYRRFRQARGLYRSLGRTLEIEEIDREAFEVELELGEFAAAARSLRSLVEARFGSASRERDDPASRAPPDDAGLTALARERAARLRRLEKSWQRSRDRLATAELVELAELRCRSGRGRAAGEAVSLALHRPDLESNPDLRPRAHWVRALLHRSSGRAEAALGSLRRCLEALGAAGSPDPAALAGIHLETGSILLEQGSLARSLDHTVRGLRGSLDAGDLRGVVEGAIRLAEFLVHTSRAAVAREVAGVAAALARSAGRVRGEHRACRLLGRVAALRGQGPGAEAHFQRAGQLDRCLGEPREACELLLEQGWWHLRQGRADAARRAARVAVELARTAGLDDRVGDLLLLVAAVDGSAPRSGGNFIRSLDALEKVFVGAETAGRPELMWQALQAMARLHRSRGSEGLAREYEKRASRLQRTCFRALPSSLAGLDWSPR